MNFHQKPVMYVSEVSLKVLSLERMTRFYHETIGFDIIKKEADKVSLGVDGRILVKLEAVENIEPKKLRYAGLYHFAILLPNRKELGKALIHLHNQGIRLASSDHLVSEALYLADPEGNGIEIYRDRDPAEWKWRDNEISMTVDPLDAEGILLEAKNANEAWSGMPAGTVIGHIHLHVSDLAEAKNFYVNGLGFELVTTLGGQALFLADQKYHHHIGLNVWNGIGVPALPEKTAGLGYYTIILEDDEERRRIADRLRKIGAQAEEKDNYWETIDPAGNRIRLMV